MKKTELAVGEALTEEEVHKMARLASSERNRLMVLTLFYSALRVAECLSLAPANLLPNNNIKVIQKGSKFHEVGMPAWLMDELRAYVKANRIAKDKSLFDMSSVNAWMIIKNLGRKMGKDIYPHLLRHSRALDLAKKTKMEILVQRHLGHRSPNTTKIYFRFLEERKAAEVIKALDEKKFI